MRAQKATEHEGMVLIREEALPCWQQLPINLA